ncbi:MAG: hypothetical protein OXG35_15215 [Acidobacteria bacterium]|nr:hypothetical protein [Acidobacteriota bacterium]
MRETRISNLSVARQLGEHLLEGPGRRMTDALQVLDVFQLFQPVGDRFLDE